MGWTPLPDGWVEVPGQVKLNILLSSWDVVYEHWLEAWQCEVVRVVQSYQGLEGLQRFSVRLVRQVLQTGQGYDAQVANYACGAIVPASRRKHFAAPEDLLCPFCKAELTVEHMLVHCPATLSCRESLTLPATLSTFELQWGLFQEPPELLQFKSVMRTRTCETVTKFFEGEDVHLFTDGSTLHPTDPVLSLSAWAVVLAEPGVLSRAKVLHDYVPGEHHTNNRAEIFAVLAAVLLGDGGVIYSDSEVAVAGFNLLLQHGWDIRQLWKHSNLDIWFAISQALKTCSGTWRIVKVNSHKEWRSAPDEQHAWLWFHNGVADEYAKAVFSQSDKRVNDCHRRAVQAVKRTRAAQAQVYALHRSVAEVFSTKHHARKSVSLNPHVGPPSQNTFQDRVGMLSADAGVVFPGKDSVPNWDVFLLCPPFAQLLFDWCSRHNWVPDEQGFSVMEMYFAFTAETGWLAPVNVAKWDKAARPAPFEKVSVKAAWVHQVQCPQISLCAQPLTSQVLVFSHVLRAVLSACKCPWKLSSKFALRCVGVSCKVPALRMRPQYHTARVVCDSLFRHFTGRLYRQVLKEGYAVVQEPVAAQIPFRSPHEIFYAHKRAHRQAQ